MSLPFTEPRQTGQRQLQLPTSPSPAPADAPAPEVGAPAGAVPNLLHDLMLQAAQRAWQTQQQTRAEAQAMQARNAFD